PAAALNVITGETGAGKSLVLQALEAVSGSRVGPGIVRNGASRAVVEAVFSSVPAEISSRLEDFQAGESDVVRIRREISREGKGKASINGTAASLNQLRSLVGALLEIHSQHEAQRLLDPEVHLETLDSFAGNQDIREKVQGLYSRFTHIQNRLRAVTMDTAEKARRLDYLRFAVNEIHEFDPKENEFEDLEQEKALILNGGRYHADISTAYSMLREEEQSVVDRLYTVEGLLEGHVGIRPHLEGGLTDLREAACRVEQLGDLLRSEKDGLQFSPERLEDIDDRLDGYRLLFKKYGGNSAGVLRTLASFRDELNGIEMSSEEASRLRSELASIDHELVQAAEELSTRRRVAAPHLEERLSAELTSLGMPGARVRVSLRRELDRGSPEQDPSQARYRIHEKGFDLVEFFLAANQGEGFQPIRKAASGGELSRVALALKSIVLDYRAPGTAVFDEVDAGVGGEVAHHIGRRLLELGERCQVIAVTHLHQVASKAETHLRIQKQVRQGRTITNIRALSNEERVHELARMLGGGSIAFEHARELIRSSKAS
ncbi:MAG: DNA repair protein RecN, partial [Spirochaetia bacterium]|nr:DNA repair protein RecN [Spirochaetia bacterium]